MSIGIIYVIQSKQTKLVYVGSTTKRLSERFNDHKSSYRRWRRGLAHSCSSRSLVIFSDAWIEEIDRIELEDANQRKPLKELEQFWQEQFGELCVNKQAAFTNIERKLQRQRDWRTANRERDLQNHQRWRAANRERELQLLRDRRAKQPVIQCPCGGHYKQWERNSHLKTQRHQRYQESLRANIINE